MVHHFYTTDPTGELAPAGGYHSEGITGYVFTTQAYGTIPIYRFYNPTTSDHFYTAQWDGEIALKAGYERESVYVGWYMFPEPSKDGSTVPLYRWWSEQLTDHFYTTDPKGELAPAAGYTSEGIIGYLFPANKSGNPAAIALNRWEKE